MDQLTQLLSGLSNRQRISILLVAVLTVGGLFAFSHWKRESDFRPLYTAMAPEDAAGVVQKLRESGVEYRLSETGGTVSIPSAKLAESRLALAAAGLPKTGRIGFELFDKTNFGATDFVEHINYKRALEGELERSVTSLAEVEQARVHLTMPKESIFLEKEQPAKASVMVKLRVGAHISQQNVIAISNLVANAVEGLGPEAVSIVDMNGNVLSRPRKAADIAGSLASSEALEIRQKLEGDLIAKIHSTLEPLIGPDRFRAGASVEYDLTSGDQEEETFDPTRSVMTNSQKTEDTNERPSTSAAGVVAGVGGIPGTASNLPATTPPVQVASAGGTSRRTENVAYQSSRVVRRTHIPQGIVRRMSLSVLVDHTVRWEGEGAARHRILEPPTPETLKTIKEVVAAATGFSTERGDQLIVESLPFETSLNPEPPIAGDAQQNSRPKPGAEQLRDWFKQNQWLVGGVAAGVILLLLIAGLLVRKMTRKSTNAARVQVAAALEQGGDSATVPLEFTRPAQIEASDPDEDRESESIAVADRVRRLAQGDAAMAANVVRIWLHETEVQVR